jgi:hypothetical protein
MGLFFFLADALMILALILALILTLRSPIIFVGRILWKLRYVLLISIGSLIVLLTWHYQSLAALDRQQQQLWVEFLHSSDYQPYQFSIYGEWPSQSVLDAREKEQYRRFLAKKGLRFKNDDGL